jgi:hypothetical protein
MQIQDIFVGTVASVVGLVLISGAAVEWHWLMQRPAAQLLTSALGKSVARVVLSAVGVALIAMGLIVALGWRMNWS